MGGPVVEKTRPVLKSFGPVDILEATNFTVPALAEFVVCTEEAVIRHGSTCGMPAVGATLLASREAG